MGTKKTALEERREHRHSDGSPTGQREAGICWAGTENIGAGLALAQLSPQGRDLQESLVVPYHRGCILPPTWSPLLHSSPLSARTRTQIGAPTPADSLSDFYGRSLVNGDTTRSSFCSLLVSPPGKLVDAYGWSHIPDLGGPLCPYGQNSRPPPQLQMES